MHLFEFFSIRFVKNFDLPCMIDGGLHTVDLPDTHVYNPTKSRE